jgi:FkbM family methyltransferase
MSENTFHSMLQRLSARVTPASVIDVGASDGRWSKMAMEFWTDASYLLIEADERHYPSLDAFCAEVPSLRLPIKAMAGEMRGVGAFSADPNDPWGGQGHEKLVPGAVAKEQVSVDAVSVLCGLSPYLLKLDTHGFEIPILKGASQTLRTACAVIIEAYTCTLQPGAVRFWELCQYMAFAGFTCTDMADPMRRPLDGRLWQLDLCFERTDAPMVGEARYK